MKTRVMKKKFRRMLCASMAAIFVMSDMMPAAFAQGTAAETLPAPTDTERIIGFEMVNPLNSYEIKAGESLESLDAPEKIRVIVELPEDTRLSTFEEREAPEQTDDTLPAYEYSHTLEQLSMSSEEDTASSGEEAAPSGEDTASSEDSSGTATSEDPSSAQEPSYTEEEIAEIYQESLTKKLGTVNVYALTDNAGASQYRVYGSIDAQAPQWYAIDENGVMLGAVEELDANWDFTGFDSTVAGEHQVKAQLPENYILSEGVEMACLQIVVTQEEEEQSSIENEDGSLPDSLPVSYIQALRAQQPRVSTATFPITVVREGFPDDNSHSFPGGEITSAVLPSIDKYIFKEERAGDGSLTSNGARLVVTENGVATAYSNVSGLYNVQQANGSYKWYYTTVTPENAVAWAVPENAYLELTYIPDPNQANQFKTITVKSGNWWDGTVNGVSQNYTIKYPVGTQVSIKVDLPTLYSNFTPSYTGISANNVNVTKTNATDYATDVGYHGNEYPIYDTATFGFTVPNSDVTIDLKFSSYAKKNGTGALQPTYLRIGQGYPTFYHNGTAYNWRGYKMVRLYEWAGLQNVTMNSRGLPTVGNRSKLPRAYQIYGPGTPPDYGTIGPSNAEKWRQDPWVTGSGTKNNPGAAQPNMHKDNSVQNGRYPDVNQFNYDVVQTGGGGVYSSRGDSVSSKVQNENGATTLAYVYENTLYSDNPNYNGDPSMSGRTMPIGVMIYTQKSSKGTFVPLETEYNLAGTSAVTDTKQKVLSTVKVDGMTVTVTRNYFKNIRYNASLNPHPNGNWRQEWMYLVTVQGATGYLGVHFVTVPDTQWALNVANVSSNIKKADILTTSGNDTASETRKWYTLGSGGYYFGYQFGDNNSTDFPQFYDGNWNTTYLNRDGGVGLRLYRKDGFGIPYLKFNITSNGTPQTVRAGINDVTLNSGTNTGKTTVNYLEGNNKKVVEGRAKKINNDTVYDFLFGFKDSSGSDTAKTNWGKSITVSVESDPMQIGYQVDLKGGSWSGKNKVIWPYGNNSYVVIPDQIPTKSNTTFRGWKVKLADGTYLKDPSAPNTDLRLQPGQIIPTTDSTYIPLDKLKLDHGVNFKSNTDVTGTGYYNTMVLQLEAVYNSTVQEGDIITAPIKVYTQKDAGVNTGAGEDHATFNGEYTEQPNLEKAGYAPWKHEYFVNYADSITVGNSKYLLNDSLSLVKGKAGDIKNSNNEYILGYLRYDKVVNVAYNIETDGKPGTGPTAPTDAGEYTTVSGHNNSITLKTPTGSYSANAFEGWKITYQDGGASQSISIPKNIKTLVLDGNQNNASSTNGTTMTIGGQAAAAIYNAGRVQLDAVWNSLRPISSGRINNGDTHPNEWNNQYKHTDVLEFYSGTELVLEGQFKYDFSTRQKILDEWAKRTEGQKASEEMSKYLDWGLYGLEGANGTVTTWSLRGDSSGGAGIKTTLELENADTDNDGYALATIRITIPGNLVTYKKMSVQQLYLFAWNDASNSQLNETYDAVAADNPNSPFSVVDQGEPLNDLSGHVVANAVASEFWYYKKMVPRGITNVKGNSSILTGDQIQWKNVNAKSQSFEVEFKYDTSVDWAVQDTNYTSGNTVDSRSIRVVVAKKDEDGTWKTLNRLNPDGTFGNVIDNNYTIELIDPPSGSDTFKVRVTAGNNAMAASADNYGTEFLVAAYNFQNGETTAPVPNDSDTSLSATVKMSDIVGDLGTNSVIGQKVPAVQSAVTFYPKGVTLDDGSLNKSVTVQKTYWQPSAQQTAVFTFDNANGTYSTANKNLKDWFDPERNNYHIGLYKKNGNRWSLEESNDTADADRKYIQGIQINGADGKVTVNYVIPAEENTANTQYRLIAFYGNIDGKNNIKDNTLQTVAKNMDTVSGDLAVMNITLNSTSFSKLESNPSNRPNKVWNDQVKDETTYKYVYTENGQQNIELIATFKYDVRSKDIIQKYWDASQASTDPVKTTDKDMGRYLNWVMYGYNTRTKQRSTWVIREQNVTGGSNNIERIDGLDINLTLGDDGIAKIKVTIPYTDVTYNKLSGQIFYLFAWNDATLNYTDGNRRTPTQFKALMHTDTSGQVTPYSKMLNEIWTGNRPASGLSGKSEEAAKWGTVPSYFWKIANVVPEKIEPVTTQMDQPQSVIMDNGKTTQILTATFKYDNRIPWNVQNVNTKGSRYAIRIGIYKQNYNSSQWERVVPVNPDGSFGDWASNYEASIISHDETQGTFTVQLKANTPKDETESVLSANYNNYGAKYKIVAYNYDNYSGNMSSLLQADGSLNPAIGTDIPLNTATVKMNPASMKSIEADGTPTNDIKGVAFDAPKTAGAKTTIAFRFQGDGASWLNGAGQSNTEMEQLFSAGGGNIIVSLWKRESDTGNFTFVDSFSGNGTLDTPSGNAADTDDYITSVNLDQDTLNVQVQAGTDSNINGTQYRVYAWYVTSNGDNTYNTSTIENAAIFGQANPTTISGTIPYATATVDMKNQAPDYYVTLPSNIILVDSDGNVKEAGTDNDISSQYAGAKAQVSYNTTNTGNIPPDQIPELTVEIENNVKMTSTAGTATDTHTVGVYFTDGYQNVTDGTQSGYVKLGTLSTIKNESGNSNKGQPGQTMPAGTTLPFYLNTKQGNDEEIYTARVTFWFDIISTTP